MRTHKSRSGRTVLCAPGVALLECPGWDPLGHRLTWSALVLTFQSLLCRRGPGAPSGLVTFP